MTFIFLFYESLIPIAFYTKKSTYRSFCWIECQTQNKIESTFTDLKKKRKNTAGYRRRTASGSSVVFLALRSQNPLHAESVPFNLEAAVLFPMGVPPPAEPHCASDCAAKIRNLFKTAILQFDLYIQFSTNLCYSTVQYKRTKKLDSFRNPAFYSFQFLKQYTLRNLQRLYF